MALAGAGAIIPIEPDAMAMILPAMLAAFTSWAVMMWVYPLLASDLSGPSKCEGYWPDAEICLDLGASRPSLLKRTRANSRCPQWQIKPKWKGRESFSTKLHDIEKTALAWEKQLADMSSEQIGKCGTETITPPIFVHRERGVAWSRIEEGIIAGNAEFHTTHPEKDGKVCWTDALLSLYVDKFGVEPTETFKSFVSSFDVDDFGQKLQELKMCPPSSSAQ